MLLPSLALIVKRLRDMKTLQLGTLNERELINPWLEDAVKGNLDATVELRIAKFAVDGLLQRQEAANQQAMLDRIDKLESFAKVALSLAGEMRKTLPPGSEISED